MVVIVSNMLVLILVLVEHTLGALNAQPTRRPPTVLILVLVEHTLGVIGRVAQIDAVAQS